MSFRSFEQPGEVLTSPLSLAEMHRVLEDWHTMTRRELVADGEGMPPANSTGEVYRRIENALRILALAQRGEEMEKS